MILQAHNSWSYLKPKVWWLRPFAFMARCQSKDIFEQYEKYGVRCFDLRVKIKKNGEVVVAHGELAYKITRDELMKHLKFINDKECIVRVFHEVRRSGQYTEDAVSRFKEFCSELEVRFPKIKFYGGRNLYNWGIDYKFEYNPSEDSIYSSVMNPKWIDDWFPWIYAKLNNRKILANGTDKDILAIDFVNIR